MKKNEAILKGYIKFQNRVKVKSQECYGVTRASGTKWSIRISRESSRDIYLFAETVFHELLHLGFYIVMACSKRQWSETAQHRIISKISRLINKEIKRR
jgi:hypothetical protein